MSQTEETGNESAPLLKKNNNIRCSKITIAIIYLSTSLFLEKFAQNCVFISLAIIARSDPTKEDNLISITVLSLLFFGTSFILPVFGGVLGDAVTGHANAIVGGGIIFFTGTLFHIYVAFDCTNVFSYCSPHADKWDLFDIGLIFIAIGIAIFHTNMFVFFAHQIQVSFGENAMRKTFLWLYWVTEASSVAASTAIMLLKGWDATQEFMSIASCFSILLSVIVFLFGISYYNPWHKKTARNLLLHALWTLKSNFMTRCTTHLTSHSADTLQKRNQAEVQAAAEAARQLGRVIPIFGILWMFWMGYTQIFSSFQVQAQRLYNSSTTQYIQADINLWAVIIYGYVGLTILTLVPLSCLVTYVFQVNSNNPGISTLAKMGIGFVFMIASMIIAAIMEIYRKQNKFQNVSFLLVIMPQVFLAGAAEFFTSVTGHEFAYTQSPNGLEGTFLGIFMCNIGIACCLLRVVHACRCEQ